MEFLQALHGAGAGLQDCFCPEGHHREDGTLSSRLPVNEEPGIEAPPQQQAVDNSATEKFDQGQTGGDSLSHHDRPKSKRKHPSRLERMAAEVQAQKEKIQKAREEVGILYISLCTFVVCLCYQKSAALQCLLVASYRALPYFGGVNNSSLFNGSAGLIVSVEYPQVRKEAEERRRKQADAKVSTRNLY